MYSFILAFCFLLLFYLNNKINKSPLTMFLHATLKIFGCFSKPFAFAESYLWIPSHLTVGDIHKYAITRVAWKVMLPMLKITNRWQYWHTKNSDMFFSMSSFQWVGNSYYSWNACSKSLHFKQHAIIELLIAEEAFQLKMTPGGRLLSLKNCNVSELKRADLCDQEQSG